ncbi:MAG: GNAT family N-acetyltransferase [Verrucomicrobiota bacterium]
MNESRKLRYLDVSETDFDGLVALRLTAMRDSLEKIGRFDRERSVERFRLSFVPEDTKKMICDHELVGFYAVANKVDHLYLSHLYVKPGYQRLGLGSRVMKKLIDQSDRRGLPIRLVALKESEVNDFYRRHGFVVTGEDEWDVSYERAFRGGV